MFWILVLGIGLDQLSKHLVMTKMAYLQSIPLFDGIFHLTYVLNEGAAFSLLTGQRYLFIGLTCIILSGCFYFYRHTPPKKIFLRCAVLMVMTGALGNLTDRIRFGAVVDFLDLGLFPVFNIADCFVVVGVCLLIITILRDEQWEKKTGEKQNGERKD